MTWLTWRQLRAQALAVYGGVLALAVVLAITGPRLADLRGTEIYDLLTPSDLRLFRACLFVLAVVPAIVGAFWGAPLVARELEAGTHRLVWNQSITRSRWLLMKVGITTLCAAVAVGALSLAISWWSAPLDGATSSTRGSLPLRLTPIAFGMRGVVPVAETVFAVTVGILLGVVLRRALPAMALTLAVMAFVQIAVPLWVRPHLLPATSQTIAISRATLDGIEASPAGVGRISVHTAHRGDWVLSQQTVLRGRPTSLPAWLDGCLPGPQAQPVQGSVRVQGPDITDCFDRLTAEGYRQHVVYQPVGRFWPLQWAETAGYLVLSALLTLVTFRCVRKLS